MWDVPYVSLVVSALPGVLAYMSVRVGANNVLPFEINLMNRCLTFWND